MAYVYLLHFERPISPDHTRQHYIGYTSNLQQRIAEHANGQGARLTQVAFERGITFTVAHVWKNGTRMLERKLKNRNGASRFCPICKDTHR